LFYISVRRYLEIEIKMNVGDIKAELIPVFKVLFVLLVVFFLMRLITGRRHKKIRRKGFFDEE